MLQNSIIDHLHVIYFFNLTWYQKTGEIFLINVRVCPNSYLRHHIQSLGVRPCGVLLFPSIPFHSILVFSKIKNCYFLPFSLLFPSTFKSLKKKGVEGNSNFKIAISFHFSINFKNCYFLPFFCNDWPLIQCTSVRRYNKILQTRKWLCFCDMFEYKLLANMKKTQTYCTSIIFC